uniref:Flagellar hook-length control protein n=1 Tax=Rhodopseudomonas palustris (strain BisA53) TaxID=316055 RepID=Q07SG2_RHOP5
MQAAVTPITKEIVAQPKDPADKPRKKSTEPAQADTTALPAEWRSPDAALSAVISRLEQVQSHHGFDNDATPPLADTQTRAEPREVDLKLGGLPDSPKTGDPAEPRFALSVDSAETRTPLPIKVAVRDQETHFEPVQQPSLLQRIVDRMAADLPAASTQASSAPAETALPDLAKAADRPVRMLTLQLDPPDLGAVTVKMRLTGDAVEIRLTAERYETRQLLETQRSALTDAMQSAGYKFDIASIDQSRSSDANAGAGQQQPQAEQRQSQQGNSGSLFNDANSQRQSADTQAGTRQHRPQHEPLTELPERHQEKEVVRDRSSGAVYL